METTEAAASDAHARSEDALKEAEAPAAEKQQQTAETKTETDRESVGSSDSTRGQERSSAEAAATTGSTTEDQSAAAAPASAAAPSASAAAKKTPTAKMPSKAKVVSARKTFDVIRAKRPADKPTLSERVKDKTAPGVNKTLSFSAVKVRGERSTTLSALGKAADKPSRAGFHYTPYKGPLPPFSNSLFAPKEVQALERLEHHEAKPKAPAPAPKKPFLVKSTGKAGGVIGRALSGLGKENAHANTPVAGADKSRRRLTETSDNVKKPVATPGRVSVKDKSTLSFQAKVRMDRRATISSAAKARATQARQAARQSTPARARPTARKTATTG